MAPKRFPCRTLSLLTLAIAAMLPALAQAQAQAQQQEDKSGRPDAAEHLVFDKANLGYCLRQERLLMAHGSDSSEVVDDYNARCAQFYLELPPAGSEMAARLVLIYAPFAPGAQALQQKLSLLCRQRPDLMMPLCPVIGCSAATC